MGSILFERAAKGEFVLIAEAGVNFMDLSVKRGVTPLEMAKIMVLEAKKAGIEVIKFQTYDADSLVVKDAPAFWDTTVESGGRVLTQHESLQNFGNLTLEEYQELALFCQDHGIEFLTTPFSIRAVDALDPYLKAYKIASADLTNVPLLQAVARKGKPMVMSVGAAEKEEIGEAVAAVRAVRDVPIALLHCVLEYPTPLDHANLRKIATLKASFPDVYIGYSDHTVLDDHCAILRAAYALGAVIIEKHYTLDKTLPGNDHGISFTPADVRQIFASIQETERFLGNGALHCVATERSARANARRSVVSAVDIRAGTVLTRKMLTCKRPGTGIAPKELEQLVGRIAACDIRADSVLTWAMLVEAEK